MASMVPIRSRKEMKIVCFNTWILYQNGIDVQWWYKKGLESL